MRRGLWLTSWAFVLESALLSMFIIAVLENATFVTLTLAVLASIVAGLMPLGASLVATCKQKAAAWIYLCATPITPLFILLLPSEFGGYLRTIALFCGAVVVPGFFWLLAARRSWPSPIPKSVSSRRPTLTVGLGVGVFCALVVGAFFWSLSLPWRSRIDDCGPQSLFDERGTPRNADFLARILFVGPTTFEGKSLWSIARVEEDFSNLLLPNIVILRGVFRQSDKSVSYFIEGSHSQGPLLRFLPIIEPVPCGRTQSAKDAAVALRLLHDGPPQWGGRLIGRVYEKPSERPVKGVGISIEGPAGTVVSTTDAQGVYDANGLPPGRYTVHLQIQEAQRRRAADFGTKSFELKAGEIGEAVFYLP